MLDTNICIFAMTGRAGPGVVARFAAETDRLCLSSVVLAELDHGVETSAARERNRVALDAFVASMRTPPAPTAQCAPGWSGTC